MMIGIDDGNWMITLYIWLSVMSLMDSLFFFSLLLRRSYKSNLWAQSDEIFHAVIALLSRGEVKDGRNKLCKTRELPLWDLLI